MLSLTTLPPNPHITNGLKHQEPQIHRRRVEWNESEGALKRTYSGFRKRSLGVVQFDTTRNRLLGAGDEFQIKIWDMNNINILTYTDADGGLPASPRLRFNKEGSLELRSWLRMLESRSFDGARGRFFLLPTIAGPSAPIVSVSTSVTPILEDSREYAGHFARTKLQASMGSSRGADVKPRILEKIKSWKSSHVSDPSQHKSCGHFFDLTFDPLTL